MRRGECLPTPCSMLIPQVPRLCGRPPAKMVRLSGHFQLTCASISACGKMIGLLLLAM